MGRMLEIFRQDRVATAPTAREAGDEPLLLPEENLAEDSPKEEVPFIEVGSGAAEVDASPGIRALMLSAKNAVAGMPILHIHPRHESKPPPHTLQAGTVRKVYFRALPDVTDTASSLPAPRVSWWHDLQQNDSSEYAGLLTDLCNGLPAESSQAWMFFTPHIQGDASVTLLRLALAAVERGQGDVIIIDTDSSSARLPDKMGLHYSPGLAELLHGHLTLDQAIRATGHPHLQVIQAGSPSVNLPRIPLGSACHDVVTQVRDRFAWVFLHAGSCLNGVGSPVLASFCDAAFLVLQSDESQDAELASWTEKLRGQGISLKGCIVSK